MTRRRSTRTPAPVALLLATAALLGVATPASAADGRWPLDPHPEVVGDFLPPSSPWGAGHRGVDLLGHAGQRVFAARAGTVTFAGPLAGRGVVVVDHGRTRATYEPVRASVAPGDIVAAGDPIGVLESFGSHCPPRACLHWGLLDGERYLDPLTLVGRGPIRLLPFLGEALEPMGAAVPAPRPDRPVPSAGVVRGQAPLFRG